MIFGLLLGPNMGTHGYLIRYGACESGGDHRQKESLIVEKVEEATNEK